MSLLFFARARRRRASDSLFRLSVDQYAPGTLVSALGGTFSRASVATYRDSNGLIQTAASGAIRDNHYELDPVSNTYVRTLLLEGSRTNLCLQSADISATGWNASIARTTSGTTTAPDGSTIPWYNFDGGQAFFQGIVGTNGQTYASSVWVKASQEITIGFRRSTGSATSADNTNFTIGTNWTRLTVSATLSTGNSFNVLLDGRPASGLSIPTGAKIAVWGAQTELGAFASSYIPTTTAAVTRAADNLTFPWNASPADMSVFLRFIDTGTTSLDSAALPRLLQIGKSDNTNPRLLVYRSNTLYAGQYNNSSNVSASSTTSKPGQGEVVEALTTLSAGGVVTYAQGRNSAITSGTPSVPVTPSPWISGSIMVAQGPVGSNNAFAAYRDIVITKGVRDIAYFRALITDDLASYDADARVVIRRAVGAGATLIDPSGTDHRAFVNSFIAALKNGGAAGDCYSVVDAMYLPILSARDSANKVSALLDGAKQKGTGFGTGGYYDATQSTASLQQVLSRGDNKGNLVLQSQAFSNAAWTVTGSATKSAITGPNGEDATQITFGATATSGLVNSANIAFTPNRSYIVYALVKAATSATSVRFAFSAMGLASGDIAVGTGWNTISYTLSATNASSVRLSNNTAGNSADVQVARIWVTESTWDSDYIATTSAPAYAGLDGKPVLVFDASLGSNAGYTTSGAVDFVPASSPITLFALSRKDGGGTTYRIVFSRGSTTDTAKRYSWLYNNNTSQVNNYRGVGIAAISTQETWGLFSACAVGTSGGSNFIRRKFGANLSAGNSGSNDLGIAGNGGRINIGLDYNGLLPMNGPLGPIIECITPLTTAQYDHIVSTLNTFFPSTN